MSRSQDSALLADAKRGVVVQWCYPRADAWQEDRRGSGRRASGYDGHLSQPQTNLNLYELPDQAVDVSLLFTRQYFGKIWTQKLGGKSSE